MFIHSSQVSGRGHRTQEPYVSAFNALPLSYSQSLLYGILAISVFPRNTTARYICVGPSNLTTTIRRFNKLTTPPLISDEMK